MFWFDIDVDVDVDVPTVLLYCTVLFRIVQKRSRNGSDVGGLKVVCFSGPNPITTTVHLAPLLQGPR